MGNGAVTRDELMLVWEGAVDPRYAADLKAAGEGNGLEIYGQASAQLERASKAVDVTTQAGYILPWSGQTNPPASGPVKAQVTLAFTRTKRLQRPLVLKAGLIWVEEETEDWGEEGPQTVRTGRRYVITQDLIFPVGVAGPLTVTALSERPGFGYNNPMPGTLRAILQPGTLFENILGTATVEIAAIPDPPSPATPYRRVTLTGINQPDMPVPEHIGQYFEFVAGANSTTPVSGGGGPRALRMQEFIPPDPINDIGSGAAFELLWAITAITGVGTFQVGEVCGISSGGLGPPYLAFARLINITANKLTFVFLTGNPDFAGAGVDAIQGLTSGAQITDFVTDYANDNLVDEAPSGGVGGASWRVLDWALDWGLSVTNAESPSGGRSGTLDQIGDERDIQRAPGESDEEYRIRVARVADTVSPNAIRRALNRALGNIPVDDVLVWYHWCFREVGSELLPGFFYDGDDEAPKAEPHGAVNDAYDTDALLFLGAMAAGSPAFRQGDPVVVRKFETGETWATGFFGKLTTGDTRLVLIRTNGKLPESMADVVVHCPTTGAKFEISEFIDTSEMSNKRKFRRLFDYAEFRAFFLVGVERITGLDSGLFYDTTNLNNAYDAQAIPNFYNGYPLRAARTYPRVKQNIDLVHAGGVGWSMYQVDDLTECGPPELPTGSGDALFNPLTLNDPDNGIEFYAWLSSEYLTLDTRPLLPEDPSTLFLSGWWKEYAGDPWVGSASGGLSGGRNAGAGPDSPSVANGFQGDFASFNGTDNNLYFAGDAIDYFQQFEGSICITFTVQGITTTLAGDNTGNVLLVGDNSNTLGIYLTRNGNRPKACLRVRDSLNVVRFAAVEIDITENAPDEIWQHIQVRWNQTTAEIRNGDGAWMKCILTAGLHADLDSSLFYAAENFAGGSATFRGGIDEIMFSKQRFSDNTMAGIVEYVYAKMRTDEPTLRWLPNLGGRRRVLTLTDRSGEGNHFTRESPVLGMHSNMPRIRENVSRYSLRGIHFETDPKKPEYEGVTIGSPNRINPPSPNDVIGSAGLTMFASLRLRVPDFNNPTTPHVTNNCEQTLFTIAGSGGVVAVIGFNSGQLTVNYFDGAIWQTATGTAGMNNGVVYTVCVTHEAGGALRVYVNGTAVVNVTCPFPAGAKFQPIGCGIYGADGFSGFVHEIMLLHGAVSTGTPGDLHNRTLELFSDPV